MKRILLFLFLSVFLFTSCKKKEEKAISFERIEVSYNDGWLPGGTILIKKDGSIKKYVMEYSIKNGRDNSYSFNDTLNKLELQKISEKVNLLKTIKVDSIYPVGCIDCSSYVVNIKTNKGTIHSIIRGILNKDNEIIRFCDEISKIKVTKNKIYKTERFMTYYDLIEPPPFIEMPK